MKPTLRAIDLSEQASLVSPNYLHRLRREISNPATSLSQPNSNQSLPDCLTARQPHRIDMLLGEPEYPKPDFIKRAMKQSIDNPKSKGYTPLEGIPELRNAVARYIKRISTAEYDPDSEILITAGAKAGLAIAGFLVADPGHGILVSSPAWTGYNCVSVASKASLIKIKTSSGVLQPSDLESRIQTADVADPATGLRMIFDEQIMTQVKAILVNSPNNPCGRVISKTEQQALFDYVSDKEVMIIADEVYKSFVFDENQYSPFCAIPGIKARLLMIDSFSKTFNMTDDRVGYIAGPPEFISRACDIQSNLLTSLPRHTQEAAIAALESPESPAFVEKVRRQYQERRDIFFDGLERIDGFNKVSQSRPQGTFYAWVNISGFGIRSIEYTERLLKEAGIACAPGLLFGDDNYVRYSLTVETSRFSEILDRHERFSKSFKKSFNVGLRLT